LRKTFLVITGKPLENHAIFATYKRFKQAIRLKPTNYVWLAQTLRNFANLKAIDIQKPIP